MKKDFTLLFIFFFLLQNLFAQIELEIWEIQGEGNATPYQGELVSTNNNIVTAVGDNFFFMQTPTSRSDNNVNTSDGIQVFYNNASTIQIGDQVSITGYVNEFVEVTAYGSNSLDVEIEATGVDLPDAFVLSENFPTGSPSVIPDLEKVEGMLVEVQATTTSPTNQYGETSIKVGTSRSFREAGIEFPAPTGLLEWDGNPEVFEFDPDEFGLTDQESLSAGMMIIAKGIMSYEFGGYQLNATEYEIIGEALMRGVGEAAENEVTIASLNCYVLANTNSNYQIRLTKFANYILNLMHAPDILAVQEVRNLATLQDLANKINSLDSEVNYTPYLISNGGSGSFIIEVGYLVRNSVSDVVVTRLGASEPFSLGGKLHHRAPLLLEANFNNTSTKSIKVLNLHLKSLSGIQNYDVKKRRHEQSISVANMVENLIDENLVVLGDLNAFQFSDGYVDVVNQIAGTPSLGAQFPVEYIVTTPLTNQAFTLPESEQYSYIFANHSQILDHCLTTDLDGMTVTKFQYIRANADNPDIYEYDASNPLRISDHDGFVMFLDLGEPLASKEIENDSYFKVKYANPFSSNNTITLEIMENSKIELELILLNGQTIYQKDMGNLQKGTHSITIPTHFPSGVYFLKINGEEKQFVGKLVK